MVNFREEVVEQIVALEEKMFLSVRAEAPASCRSDPETFRIMRRAQFSAWPPEALISYYQDLEGAVSDGRNLMTIKYARMDDIIPPLTDNPDVSEIVVAQLDWQRELLEKYPRLMGRARPVAEMGVSVSFEKYLRSELETYSDRTLSCLKRAVEQMRQSGENMSEKIYRRMVRELGYDSIQEADQAAAAAAAGGTGRDLKGDNGGRTFGKKTGGAGGDPAAGEGRRRRGQN